MGKYKMVSLFIRGLLKEVIKRSSIQFYVSLGNKESTVVTK